MTQKGFELDHIKLIWNLNKGEINFEEYLRRRGLNKNYNLWELKYIVNDNQYMLNEFLAKISIGLRCRAMKGLLNLTNRDIENFTNFRKSTIGYFISDNMLQNKDRDNESQRNTSIELIYDLAIIYDIPFRYLANNYTKYEMINTFEEYNTRKIKVKKLHEVIEEISVNIKNGFNKKRHFYGVKIINDFFDAGEKKFLYTRVDIREKFFIIEIHLENEANINSLELLKLEKLIGLKHEIYIRNAFLRNNKKLYILIPFDGTLKPDVIYLHKDFLWRNVLYNLKDQTLKNLEKNLINPHF